MIRLINQFKLHLNILIIFLYLLVDINFNYLYFGIFHIQLNDNNLFQGIDKYFSIASLTKLSIPLFSLADTT